MLRFCSEHCGAVPRSLLPSFAVNFSAAKRFRCEHKNQMAIWSLNPYEFSLSLVLSLHVFFL